MPTISRRVSVTYTHQEVAEIIIDASEPGSSVRDRDLVIEDKNDSIIMTLCLPKRAFSDQARDDSDYSPVNGGSRVGEVTVDEYSGNVTVVFDDEA